MNTSSTYAQNKIHPQVGAKMRILVLLVLGGSKWDSLPLVQVVVSDEYYLILLFVKTTLLFLLHTSRYKPIGASPRRWLDSFEVLP